MNSIIKRGDIFYADLGVGVGAVQGGIRPVVIIQNDIANKYSPTVIVAAITSKIRRAKLPTHVEIFYEQYDLDGNWIILLEQIFTLDKKMLRDKLGTISPNILKNVDNALSISMSTSIDKKTVKLTKNDDYIHQLTKPLVITEGKTDVILIETAWQKLYPNTEMFFECQSSGIEFEEEKRTGGAEKLRRQIEFLSTTEMRPVIGVFDNDREGNQQFGGLNKEIFEKYDIKSTIRKHKNKNIWGMLLPVPDERELFVTKDDANQRYFVIEHYFSNEILKRYSMCGSSILGTSVFEVNNSKSRFAEEVNNLEAKEFESFRILFEKIEDTFKCLKNNSYSL